MSVGDKYVQIIREIIQSPRNRISHERFQELLDCNRQNIHNHKKKLCDGPDAMLTRIKNDHYHPDLASEGISKYYYTLKGSMSDIEGLNNESLYFLEAYKHMGYLLDSAVEEVQTPHDVSDKEVGELKRKFFYLSKVQAKSLDDHLQEWLKQIVSSLLTNKKIALWYPSKNDPLAGLRREVKPLSLCQYRDDLYLLGEEWKHLEEKWLPRSYKISRIDKFEETIEEFKYPSKSKWNPEDRFKFTSGLITLSDNRFYEADVKIYGEFRRFLNEKFFMSALKRKLLCTDEYDYYTFKYTNKNEFLGQLFTYAECIEILGPDDLRDDFVTKAQLALEKNKTKKVAS